jgi:hypothetical protein
MEKLVLGLCKGRHAITQVSRYIFPTEVDPTNMEYMRERTHIVLSNCSELELYVTGLTVMEYMREQPHLVLSNCSELELYVTGLTVTLVTVINYCCANHIPLTLMHFDRNTSSYYAQIVQTKVDYDSLVEGGYYPHK